MKYVSRGSTGVFDLTRYELYLEEERAALAACIDGTDLLSLDRFVPSGPGSFHDARFESLSITTRAVERAGSGAQLVSLEVRLKGPYFDRYFELRYDDVISCSFRTPGLDDDLLMHEVRIDNGVVTHELQFDRDKAIAVTSRKMHFLERLETARV